MIDKKGKIGIIGIGLIGSVILGFFKRKGFDVFSYEKNENKRLEIEKRGIIIQKNGLIKIPPFKTFNKLNQIPFEEIDFLIISVKSYDLGGIIKKLPESVFKIPIVCFQNGIGIEDLFKKHKNINLFRFVSHFAVYKNKNGKIILRELRGSNYLGGKADEKTGKEICNLFNFAGIKTVYKRDIKFFVWERQF